MVDRSKTLNTRIVIFIQKPCGCSSRVDERTIFDPAVAMYIEGYVSTIPWLDILRFNVASVWPMLFFDLPSLDYQLGSP